MKNISLTRGQIAVVDDSDYAELVQFTWRAMWYEDSQTFYAATGASPTIFMHRMILDVLPDQHVDHRDHNGLNNQRMNIRLATSRQNHWNARKPRRKKACSSAFKGVAWNRGKNKWKAYIFHSGKQNHLGYFSDETEAAKAYDAAARIAFGEFACPNFSEGSEGAT